MEEGEEEGASEGHSERVSYCYGEKKRRRCVSLGSCCTPSFLPTSVDYGATFLPSALCLGLFSLSDPSACLLTRCSLSEFSESYSSSESVGKQRKGCL